MSAPVCLCGHGAGSHSSTRFNCLATTDGTHATRCSCKCYTSAPAAPAAEGPPDETCEKCHGWGYVSAFVDCDCPAAAEGPRAAPASHPLFGSDPYVRRGDAPCSCTEESRCELHALRAEVAQLRIESRAALPGAEAEASATLDTDEGEGARTVNRTTGAEAGTPEGTYNCTTEGCCIGDCPNCLTVTDLRERLAAAWRAQDLTHGHMERLAKEDAETRVALGCPADDRSTSEGARLISDALTDAHAMLDEHEATIAALTSEVARLEGERREALVHVESSNEECRRLASEVADLTRRNCGLEDRIVQGRAQNSRLMRTGTELRAENARLASEVRALREDKARLDAIDAQYRSGPDGYLVLAMNGWRIASYRDGYHVAADVFSEPIVDGATLREAIDAARLASPSPTGAP